MDIITQVILGASVGEAVLGKKVGSKAAAWGALGGFLPDLDIFFSCFVDLPQSLLFHRGITHSIIVAFLFSPLLAMFAAWIHRKKYSITFDWTKLFFWTLLTHPILDMFTTYGTGFFEPFSDKRIAFSSIAIVDLFYTLPLAGALVFSFFMKKTNVRRRLAVIFALGLTTLYLGFTMINKMYVTSVFGEELQEKGVKFTRLHTYPVLPHNFKWLAVAEIQDGYYISYYSHFSNKTVSDFFMPKNDSLSNILNSYPKFHVLRGFSKDLYALKQIGDNSYEYYDLRFGKLGMEQSSEFIFTFYITIENDAMIVEQKERNIDFSKIEF